MDDGRRVNQVMVKGNYGNDLALFYAGGRVTGGRCASPARAFAALRVPF